MTSFEHVASKATETDRWLLLRHLRAAEHGGAHLDFWQVEAKWSEYLSQSQFKSNWGCGRPCLKYNSNENQDNDTSLAWCHRPKTILGKLGGPCHKTKNTKEDRGKVQRQCAWGHGCVRPCMQSSLLLKKTQNLCPDSRLRCPFHLFEWHFCCFLI